MYEMDDGLHDDDNQQTWTSDSMSTSSTPTPQHANVVSIATIAGIIMAIAIGSNGCVFLAIGTARNLRRINNILIISQAACDFSRCLIVMPMYISTLFSDQWSSPIACRSYHGVRVSLETASLLHTVIVSLERVFVISRPLLYQRVVSWLKVLATIGGVWVVSFVYGMSHIAWIKNDDDNHNEVCALYKVHVALAVFDLIFRFLIPLVVIVVTNVKIFGVVRSQIMRIRPVISTSIDQSEHRTHPCDLDLENQGNVSNSGQQAPRHKSKVKKIDKITQTDPNGDDLATPNKDSHHSSDDSLFGSGDYQASNKPKTPRKNVRSRYPRSDLRIEVPTDDIVNMFDKETGEITASPFFAVSDVSSDDVTDEDIPPGTPLLPVNEHHASSDQDRTASESSQIMSHDMLQVQVPSEIEPRAAARSILSSENGKTSTFDVPTYPYTKRGSVTFDTESAELGRQAPKLETVLIDDETTYSGDNITMETSVSSLHRCQSMRDPTALDPRYSQIWTTSHTERGSNTVSGGDAQSKQPRRNSSLSSRRRNLLALSNNKAAKLTVCLVASFVCCFLPYRVSQIMYAVCDGCVPITVQDVVSLLTFLSCVINPLVFNFYSSEFRAAVILAFPCSKQRRAVVAL